MSAYLFYALSTLYYFKDVDQKWLEPILAPLIPHKPIFNDPLSEVPPQKPAFDHTLTPQRIGDTLVGHNGETDRFVFDDPSLSTDLKISVSIQKDADGKIIPIENMDLGGREPIAYWQGLKLMTPAVQIKNFNPQDGDILDFSALSQVSSYLGHTPSPHAVWTKGYDDLAHAYPIAVDLDGDPTSVEMGLYIHLTDADKKEVTYDWNNDGVIDMEGYEVSPHKTMTDDMFLFA